MDNRVKELGLDMCLFEGIAGAEIDEAIEDLEFEMGIYF